MAVTTTDSRDFDVQVFTDIVQGVFAGKDALVGTSQLASSGAIMVSGEMPFGGPGFVGNTIQVPYFGTLGEFAQNNENTAVTPAALSTTNETATIDRSSMAFEVTKWAQASSLPGADPYMESARQLLVAAGRHMDSLCITAAATTPLVSDLYSASVPVIMDWDAVVDACAKWGDENQDVRGMVVHSRVEAGLRKLRDANGRPLLLDSMNSGSRVRTFQGIPLIVSDRVPLTSSTMTAVTSSGTSPPVATITGTPTGAWNLKIDLIAGTAHETATIKFSTDGGQTYSAALVTAAAGVALPLIDTAIDSLVGNNGTTGLSVAFAAGTFNADNLWTSNAVLKATSLIFQEGAMAFWFNRALMSLQTDKDILKDNDVAAMHMYRVAHLYRRRRGGTKPGVVALKTNVPGFLPA